MQDNITELFGHPFVGPPEPLPLDQQVRLAMSGAGIIPPETIIMDGRIHRYNPTESSHGEPCWYVFFTDGTPAGKFGDWRTGVEMNFRANIARDLTPAEEMAINLRMAEAQKRRDEEIHRRRESAAIQVKEIWSMAGAADDTHPYLVRKGIKGHGARIAGDGRLIVPLFGSDGVLSTLQYIDSDGEKRYHPGGATGSKFWMVGGVIKDKIFIAEGFATAATVYEETGIPCIVAYSASNLVGTTKEIRELYPTHEIVIVADNDVSGTGKNYADQCSAKYGAMVILCPQAGDVNDYRSNGGDLNALLNPKTTQWLESVECWDSQPAPIKWLLKGWIQEGGLVMAHGPSGGGKTFVILDILLHMATGKKEWNGCKVKECPVVYLAGEGHHGLRSRVAAWAQYHKTKPKNMWVSRGATDLNKPDGLQKVLSYVRSLPVVPKVLAVDTLHRFMDGDENSTVDSKSMIDACAILQAEFGCTVVLVHHTGVSDEAQHRGRGSSSWRGAMENEISIRPDGEVIIIEAKKIKDAEEPEPIHVKLESIEIEGWFDEDNEQVKSAIIAKTDAPEKRTKSNTTLQRNIKELQGAWYDSGCEIVDDAPYISKSALKTFMVVRLDKSESAANQEVKPSAGKFATRLIESGMITEHLHGFKVINPELQLIWSGTIGTK